MQIGKASERLVVRPIDGSARNIFRDFNIANAQCFYPANRETLLAVVESSFGDVHAFNRVMRVLLNRQSTLDRNLKNTVEAKPVERLKAPQPN